MFDSPSLYDSTTSISGSATVRKSFLPGPERDAIIKNQLEAFQARADNLPTLIDELRSLMAGRDLTQLINSVAVPAMMVGIDGAESLADGELTSSWAAKIEYLVGVALSLEAVGTADTPHEVTRRVRSLISEIFDAEQARRITAFTTNADIGDLNREVLLQQLQLEYQTDRMPGYAVHLEQVDAEVFGRHREYYVTSLGFNPADVIRATRLNARSLNRVFSAAIDTLRTAMDGPDPDPQAAVAFIEALNATTLWVPLDVAASTGIAVEQISAMLAFFSTDYGCQPEFRAPGDTNRARTHPCIKLDNGTFFVPDPWALSAAIHHRLATEPKRNGFDSQRYYKHRQDAHERLVSEAMAKVFGPSNTFPTQHYALVSKEKGEIDTLIRAEWPLVVEAKAIALTERGRRGYADRVDKKIAEILGKALDQTDRALTYILDEGGRSFTRTANGRQVDVLPREVSSGTAVIVTFERIDPFASSGLSVSGAVKRPTWVVSLTDLLMVTDILMDPASFHHYARERAGMHSIKASAASECDALGAYLIDRISILHSLDHEEEEIARILIADSSDALNDFYTRRELGLEAQKPTVGVPEEILDAMASTLLQAGWAEVAAAVMSAQHGTWSKWKRFRRRHRNSGTFALNDQVTLAHLAKGEPAVERTGGSVFLSIPIQR